MVPTLVLCCVAYIVRLLSSSYPRDRPDLTWPDRACQGEAPGEGGRVGVEADVSVRSMVTTRGGVVRVECHHHRRLHLLLSLPRLLLSELFCTYLVDQYSVGPIGPSGVAE
jgi:hypothetical protein